MVKSLGALKHYMIGMQLDFWCHFVDFSSFVGFQFETDSLGSYIRFQVHFKSQLGYLKRYYNPSLYGPFTLQIKFGRTYVISPPNDFVEDTRSLRVKDITDALDRKKLRGAILKWDDGPVRPSTPNPCLFS